MTTVQIGRQARDAAHALLLARAGRLACEVLPGDASDRAFMRVPFAHPSKPATAILLRGAEHPFVETARLLRAAGVPVPEIYAEDEPAGIVIEEDFGDVLLQERAREASPVGPATSSSLSETYRQLVDLLVSLQRGFPWRPPGDPRILRPAPLALARAFDADAFERELLQFEERMWRGHLGACPTPSQAKAVRRHLRALAEKVASFPLRLAHRDFHSRNILVRPGGTVGIVDFQDARFGPPHYDLASLLFDGYATLEADFAAELFARYEEAFPSFADRRRAIEAFELTAAQRVLKALGSFAFLAQAKGKGYFLDFVPKSLGDAALLLSRRKELRPLRAILAATTPAFA